MRIGVRYKWKIRRQGFRGFLPPRTLLDKQQIEFLSNQNDVKNGNTYFARCRRAPAHSVCCQTKAHSRTTRSQNTVFSKVQNLNVILTIAYIVLPIPFRLFSHSVRATLLFGVLLFFYERNAKKKPRAHELTFLNIKENYTFTHFNFIFYFISLIIFSMN